VQVVLSAIFVYISTSIDYLILMTIIFSQFSNRQSRYQIVLGQYVGVGFLVFVSLIATHLLNFVPEDWMVGLLGFIPMFLGIRIALTGEDSDAEEDLLKIVNQENTSSKLVWLVAFVNIVAGGDNIGVYIPYFASLAFIEIMIVIILFAVSILLFSYACIRLGENRVVARGIEKTERWLVPVVFILLGIWILFENGTISYFL